MDVKIDQKSNILGTSMHLKRCLFEMYLHKAKRRTYIKSPNFLRCDVTYIAGVGGGGGAQPNSTDFKKGPYRR